MYAFNNPALIALCIVPVDTLAIAPASVIVNLAFESCIIFIVITIFLKIIGIHSLLVCRMFFRHLIYFGVMKYYMLLDNKITNIKNNA